MRARSTQTWAIPVIGQNWFVANPEAANEIGKTRAKYPKGLYWYSLLGFYGPNILIVEGDEWKRYRKIIAPSFSEVETRSSTLLLAKGLRLRRQRNNRLVWDGTIKIMDDLFEDVWGSKEEVTVDNSTDITIPVS